MVHVSRGEGTLQVPGSGSAYLRRPDGTFELIGVGSLGEEREAEARWLSPDGDLLIFSTGGKEVPGQQAKQLEPDAAPTGTPAIYDRSPLGGPTHVISLLPGDVPLTATEGAFFQGASRSGNVVAFIVQGGALYVRMNDSSTVLVPTVGGGTQTFAGLSSDGHHLFFVEGGDVFSFDTGAQTTRRVTDIGNAELASVSSDGSHAYFVSKSQINAEGTPGEPNLYVWDAGSDSTAFIATVSAADLGSTQRPRLNNWTTRVVNNAEGNPNANGPGYSSARSTPDGAVLAFESAAKLTSYENAGKKEIYRYGASDHSLICVSCNPSGATAVSPARFQIGEGSVMSSQLVVNNLSEDGEEVFFETKEALLPRDVDKNNDIYEWHGGPGPELSLISSGQTPLYPSGFGEPALSNVIGSITPSGSDVFFRTVDALTPTAGIGGANAFYDARVGGGFPPGSASPCQGEGCQSSSGTPALGQPSSASYSGPGNAARKHAKKKKHAKKRHRKATRPHRQTIGAPK